MTSDLQVDQEISAHLGFEKCVVYSVEPFIEPGTVVRRPSKGHKRAIMSAQARYLRLQAKRDRSARSTQFVSPQCEAPAREDLSSTLSTRPISVGEERRTTKIIHSKIYLLRS
ncbi:hypothetical protein TNCV_3215281 [Trichonephila clavipes]|nr:hypothetical protein TNCV_3215281 [Trichonephila clavipes]